MSVISKIQANGNIYELKDSGIVYVDHNVGGNPSAVAIDAPGFNLHKGALIAVRFHGKPSNLTTMNINGSGAKAVYRKGEAIGSSNLITNYMTSEDTCAFLYDGTRYDLIYIDRAASLRMYEVSDVARNEKSYSWSFLRIRKFGHVVMLTFRLTGVPKKDVAIISGLPRPIVDIQDQQQQFGWLYLDSNTGNLICNSAATVSSVNLLYTLTYLSFDVEYLPLAGKKIAFLGDSITERWVWPPFITNKLGGTPINLGIGSTPLSGTNANAFWRETRLNAIKNQDPDYLMILGGANDLVLNPMIGSSSDLASKDTNTFIGAYSYIISNLLAWKPTLKIYILSTTWAHNDGADYSQTVTYGDFAAACKIVADHYRLPYVDFYNKSGFNVDTVGSGDAAIYSDDHIHPTELGGMIMAELVISELKKIL